MSHTSLFEDLRSPDPSVRYSVLSRIETRQWTGEQVAEFRTLAAAEVDPGTRFHMDLILKLKDRSGETGTPKKTSVKELEAAFSGLAPDFLHLALVLQHLDPSQIPLALDLLREKNWQEFPDEILPFILRLVKKHGSAQDLPAIESCCRHHHPRVLGAAIEALEKLNPDDLKSFIVPLLVNSSPGIQSLAIRLLHRWDKFEALAHFEALLFDELPVTRDTALFHAFFFPFEEIEPLMLRFLGLEEDPGLLNKASRLFIINPAFSTVERLSDLFESASGSRKELLRQTILAEIDFLVKSGTVQKTAEEILKDLRESHRRRRAVQILERCRALLREVNEEHRRLALLKLFELRGAGFSEAETLLRNHQPSESAPSLKLILQQSLGTPPTPSAVAVNTPLVKQLINNEGEAWKQFDLLPWEERHGLLKHLGSLVQGQGIPTLVRALSSGDPALVMATLDILAEKAPKELLPRLAEVLQAEQPDVQAAALRCLALIDRQRALPTFETFLFSVQVARRRVAILSLPAFDFPSVRLLVVRAVSREADEQNRSSLAGFLESHLEEGLFFEVFSCWRKDILPVPALEPVLKKWAETIAAAGRSSHADALSLWRAAGNQVEDQRQREKAGAEYSVENIRCLRSSTLPEAAPVASPPIGSATPAFTGEFSELSRPGVTARFLALWRMNATSWTPERREEFRQLAESQTDAGLRFHMRLVLARAESPSGKEPPLVRANRLLKSDPVDLLTLMLECERLPRRDSRVGLEMLKKAGWWNFPSETLPFVLTLVKRFGTSEDGALVEPLCRHSDPRVVMMAVEALEKLNPEDLRPLLVPLLSHEDSGVRGAAIRLLTKWDQPEALRHFEAFLFADDAADRDSALFFAYFFPFPDIEPLLLKFLGLENDPGLLKKTGYLFQVNPGVEEPSRLIEVWETSSGEKKQLIGQVLTGVVNALAKSGLIQKPAEEILSDLQTEYRARRVKHLIEQCRVYLDSPDSLHRSEACRRLRIHASAGSAEAVQTLRDHVARESDPVVRKSLEAFLGVPGTESPRPGVSASPLAPAVPATPADLSAADRLRWLDGLDATTFRQHRKLLQQWLEQLPPEEKEPVVRLFGRLGVPEDALLIKKQFREGPPGLVVALIDALRRLDVSLLDPLFPRLIVHPADPVREASVRAFVLRDKKQALIQVEQMLASNRPQDLAMGIFALSSFDFPSIADLTFSLLERERDVEHLRQLGVLVKANLSEKLFVRLVVLADKAVEPVLALFQQMTDDGAAQLVQTSRGKFPDVAAVLQWARDQIQEEESRRKTPPVYALANIQKIRQQKAASLAPPPSEVFSQLLETARSMVSTTAGQMQILVFFLLVGLLGWVFSGETIPEPPVRTYQAGAGTGSVANPRAKTFEIDEVRDVQGLVNSAFADGVLITPDSSEEKVFVRFLSAPRPFRPGDAFRGRIKIEKRNRTRYEASLVQLF